MKTDCLIWGPGSNQNAIAMYSGCKAAGFAPEYLAPSGFHPNDHVKGVRLVCVLGLRPRSKMIFDYYKGLGIPVLVIDSAYIFRNKNYMQVGLNGLNWIPPEAPHDRAEAMGLIPKGTARSKRGDKILLCRQKPGDAQHLIPDVNAWLDNIKKDILKISDREIIDRPHPQVSSTPSTLQEDLSQSWCMVTYNSTAAYEAMLVGVPVFCDPVAVYKECASTDFSKIEKPYLPSIKNRQNFLDRMAYGQFKLDEISEGWPIEWCLKHA